MNTFRNSYIGRTRELHSEEGQEKAGRRAASSDFNKAVRPLREALGEVHFGDLAVAARAAAEEIRKEGVKSTIEEHVDA